MFVGAGPFDDKLSLNCVDAIVRFDTNIRNDLVFYTDSNGLELKPRKHKARPWHPFYTDPHEPGEPVLVVYVC